MSESCPVRLIRDTRVRAFKSRSQAEAYLKERNILSCYCPLTETVWKIMCEEPDKELVLAYEDIAQAEAFGATERYLAFLAH